MLADGSPILGVDVDAAGLITLRKMGRPVMPMSVTELETVVRYVHDMGRKFIVKGIMTPDDAHRAIDAGCDAIVVSNHGGRVLDHCPGTATVLPAIADAVRGKITILADGAVRDGVDVLKMLALGADAVLVGRPLCIAAIGGGVEGVAALPWPTCASTSSIAASFSGEPAGRGGSPSLLSFAPAGPGTGCLPCLPLRQVLFFKGHHHAVFRGYRPLCLLRPVPFRLSAPRAGHGRGRPPLHQGRTPVHALPPLPGPLPHGRHQRGRAQP